MLTVSLSRSARALVRLASKDGRAGDLAPVESDRVAKSFWLMVLSLFVRPAMPDTEAEALRRGHDIENRPRQNTAF